MTYISELGLSTVIDNDDELIPTELHWHGKVAYPAKVSWQRPLYEHDRARHISNYMSLVLYASLMSTGTCSNVARKSPWDWMNKLWGIHMKHCPFCIGIISISISALINQQKSNWYHKASCWDVLTMKDYNSRHHTVFAIIRTNIYSSLQMSVYKRMMRKSWRFC